MRRAERATHHRTFPADLLPSAVFGGFDSINGLVGLMVGLLAGHASTRAIVTVVLAAGAANSVSMSGGEMVSDVVGSTRDRWLRCLTMGGVFLVVSLAPPVGFLFSRSAGVVTMLALTPLVLVGITSVRARFHGWWQATLTVGAIFALAAVTAYGAALLGAG